MGEINLPASAPNASSDSLELSRNISSVQAAPSMFFMGCLGPLLQHLVEEKRLGSVELRPAPLWQLLGSSTIWVLEQVKAQLRKRNKVGLFNLFAF